MEESMQDGTVSLPTFVFSIYQSDGKVILDRLDMVASSFGLDELERRPLNELARCFQYENLLLRMFEIWLKKMEEEDPPKSPTLRSVAMIMDGIGFKSVEGNLTRRYTNLDRVIVAPKSPTRSAGPEEAKTEEDAKEDSEETKEDEKGKKQSSKGGIRRIFSSKKSKIPSTKVNMGVVGGKLGEGGEEEEEEPPEEPKYLPDGDAAQLAKLVDPFRELDTSLQIIEFLSRSVYHVAAIVPKEDAWIQKVALVSMEIFAIVRHFIEPGKAIHRNKFEGVVRRYIVDPGLAPQLIGALVVSELLIQKANEKKALLLLEPAVKDAMDELQKLKIVQKFLGGPYLSLTKTQEKLLVAVVAAVEEHRYVDDQKAFGKALSPHISYLVRDVVWPLKHPGFGNIQAKIPKVIRFCSESVVAVAKQRYDSLPNVSEEDLAIFDRAYAKAQAEKLNLAGIAAGAALGVGVSALAVGGVVAAASD